VDDIDRLRAFEIERVRRNPTSLLSPRFHDHSSTGRDDARKAH
jgi:hypothetical protein